MFAMGGFGLGLMALILAAVGVYIILKKKKTPSALMPAPPTPPTSPYIGLNLKLLHFFLT